MACAFAGNLGQMIAMRDCRLRRRRPDPDGVHHGRTRLPKCNSDRPRHVRARRHLCAGHRPTIGGYLTENYGWQTIFINTAPGLAMVVALWSAGQAADAARLPRTATGRSS